MGEITSYWNEYGHMYFFPSYRYCLHVLVQNVLSVDLTCVVNTIRRSVLICIEVLFLSVGVSANFRGTKTDYQWNIVKLGGMFLESRAWLVQWSMRDAIISQGASLASTAAFIKYVISAGLFCF